MKYRGMSVPGGVKSKSRSLLWKELDLFDGLGRASGTYSGGGFHEIHLVQAIEGGELGDCSLE